MKKIICLFWGIFINVLLYAQDTVSFKSVKGYLFIPAFHSYYDKGYVGEMRPGYNDYFFPISNPNIELLRDSNIEISFKNCMRVEINSFHDKIKKQAIQLALTDTTSETSWYGIWNFYVVPVIMDYKAFKDDYPKMMSQDSFVLQVTNGAKFCFYPQRRAILPVRTRVLLSGVSK